MNTRLFVANIPFAATQVDLDQLFVDYGFSPKEVKIVLDRESGRSRGFGFVEFATPDEATQALKVLDNVAQMEGRFLVIREADQRPQRAPGRTNEFRKTNNNDQ